MSVAESWCLTQTHIDLAEQIFGVLLDHHGGTELPLDATKEATLTPLYEIIEEVSETSRKNTIGLSEWMVALDRFGIKAGLDALAYILEWLRGTHLGFGDDFPKHMVNGAIGLYMLLERISSKKGFISRETTISIKNGEKIFQSMDTSGDGEVSQLEFFCYFLKYVVMNGEIHASRVIQMLTKEVGKHADVHSDADLAKELDLFKRVKLESDALKLFQLLDYDHSGGITRDELIGFTDTKMSNPNSHSISHPSPDPENCPHHSKHISQELRMAILKCLKKWRAQTALSQLNSSATL